MDYLTDEIPQLKRLLDRRSSEQKEQFKTAQDLAVVLHPYREAFPKLYKLVQISLTLPISTSSAERSFSKLRIIKTYLRSRMGSARLSNLAILSIESDRAEKLNFDQFVDEFANAHQTRRIKKLL